MNIPVFYRVVQASTPVTEILKKTGLYLKVIVLSDIKRDRELEGQQKRTSKITSITLFANIPPLDRI